MQHNYDDEEVDDDCSSTSPYIPLLSLSLYQMWSKSSDAKFKIIIDEDL